MNDISPYPPYLYLCQAVDYAPQTLRVYMLLWRDYHHENVPNGKMYFEDTFEQENYISWDEFLEQIRELAYIGLIEYHKVNDGICIILAQDNQINGTGYSLC